MTAGDTLRFSAQAVDSSGSPVASALIRFVGSGGRFEGRVDSAGLVSAGSTGVLGVTAIASVPGTRPVMERVEISMQPGPAALVTITPQITRLVAGQRFMLTGASFSGRGDKRADKIKWRSSAPRVADVATDGLLTASAPGKATITASVDGAKSSFQVEVLAVTIGSLEISPAKIDAKQGDVVRFTVTARDRAGKKIEGLTPRWSFSPGEGLISEDGAFVGYDAGSYLVTATLGNRSVDAALSLAYRDVRRPATIVGRLPRSLFSTEEVWVHPDGKHLYLGTGGGGDRMYAVDISDPSNPVVTDSLMANTRRVNDIMTTPDG
ncbi:MAG TPA: Ig-like domain-containing protein, partial [Gemmatimonadales bacterium]|nr:Ig-like domain-containing protein [Gemmatimonadales bacterium]